MNHITYQPVWNLHSIFDGGSESAELHKHMKTTEVHLKDLDEKVKTWSVEDSGPFIDIIHDLQEIRRSLSQARSYIICLLAQNHKNRRAQSIRGEITALFSRYESIKSMVKKKLSRTPEYVWEEILAHSPAHRFILTEWREEADLEPGEEVSDLMADGYHAWGQIYQSFMSSITVTVKGDELSVGQAINLRSHSDPAVREEAHSALVEKWSEHEGMFAQILNHLAGFRLGMYKSAGIGDVLTTPLAQNRMKEETLNAMMRVIEKNKKPFADYLHAKAAMLGDTKMKSFHFGALLDSPNRHIEYDKAVSLIKERFASVGQEMGQFAEKAFNDGWVDAENRPDKQAVAFCAGFPKTNESRVFLTFNHTFKGVLSLVHELGHAFHNHAMKSVDILNRQYPMSLAETASTFAEMVMLEEAFNNAETDEERLFILDEKLKRSVMNFMNLHARFIFEKEFHEERRKGFVSSSRLNELMESALERGYDGSLEEWPVHTWIWTPHFYKTEAPFYNFPYTFGYLLALNFFAQAKDAGDTFEERFMALLKDSGSMTAEDLVMKHLGEDITEERFWEKGMELCLKDSEEFIKLAARLKK
ncbi:M3 family oligoendopeptidase [Bacillus sp. KH172YL63]|uniref:M3 family oligoendopeptidase n=1 Tax=Bacillus sp. KH172YL63 TaxID=2709784 RepID=UPI0013E43588|nr:M3 family oligoendopeptidase [Bacillus sp. KH172YL63]BCB04214.1 oligoendopeptidase [Bacillus sp. KH172YL63]